MKKILYILLAFSVVLFFGCRNNGKNAESHSTEHSDDEGHEGHDHGDDNGHEGHDHGDDNGHEGHDHGNDEGDNHDDHAGHDHDGKSDEVSGHIDAKEAGGEVVDEIIFPKAQAERVDFAVEQVKLSSFSDIIKTSGQILAAQGDEVYLVAPASGIVSFGNNRLTEGNSIGKGQSLFFVSSKNLATGDIYAKAEASYSRAKAEFDRTEKLLADNIVSRKEYETARSEYLQAKIEYDALQGMSSARGVSVQSSISGYLTSLTVQEGEFVEMGQPLATVSQNRRLILRAEVSQKYYGRLATIRSASFITPEDKLLSLDKMNGKLVSVGKAATIGSYMIPVTFEFNNPGNIVTGSYVEIFLQGKIQENVISVPISAVTEQQGVYYVYVQLDEEGYQRREVIMGQNDGNNVRIIKGLKNGERVVTRGAVHVKMAAMSASIPHGHSH